MKRINIRTKIHRAASRKVFPNPNKSMMSVEIMDRAFNDAYATTQIACWRDVIVVVDEQLRPR